MTSDGATWYYATDGLVHRILNGVETTVNPRDILPSTVSLSRVVSLPNNGVAFSTTNYDNGWANAGVYYITVDGVASCGRRIRRTALPTSWPTALTRWWCPTGTA